VYMYKSNASARLHESTFYRVNSNDAKVFAASGMQWVWGLDDWGAKEIIGPVIKKRLASEQPNAQKITKNILNCFLTNAPCVTTP
jgi:hypothetical protein